jgi:hypothetical protein
MITPRGHIKLLLQDSVVKHSVYQDNPWAHPLGVSPGIFKDFLKKSYPQNIRNECTATKEGDRLRWKEVQMWLLECKSNQQKH